MKTSEDLGRLQASVPAPGGEPGQGLNIGSGNEVADDNDCMQLEGEDTVAE